MFEKSKSLVTKKLRPNKYGVSPKSERTIDGIAFDSKLEMNRYLQLKLSIKSGVIKDLVLQPVFELLENFTTNTGEKIRGIKYMADFQYTRISDGALIVEDTKSTGTRTKEYLIKRKLFLIKYRDRYFFEVAKANEIGGIFEQKPAPTISRGLNVSVQKKRPKGGVEVN